MKNERVHIKGRIHMEYRALNSNKTMLRDKELSKNAKIKIYTTAIRLIVTYATETANLTQQEEEQLSVFVIKIIRTIMGPKKNEKEYRQLMNQKLMVSQIMKI